VTVLVGVAGGTGSGKTTVSHAVLDRLGPEGVTHLQHDSYYRDHSHLPREEREEINYDHPDALETELLVEHLRMLTAGHEVEVPVYDFTRHVRTDRTLAVDPNPVVLVEGILVLAEPPLRKLFDVKVYVDTAADIRFIRRLRRDMEERGRSLDSVVEQYRESVRPMHREFVEPSKRHADVIVPEGGFNAAAMDLLADHIARRVERME
jgi:uridine kinase